MGSSSSYPIYCGPSIDESNVNQDEFLSYITNGLHWRCRIFCVGWMQLATYGGICVLRRVSCVWLQVYRGGEGMRLRVY